MPRLVFYQEAYVLADGRLARRIHFIQEFEEALSCDLGQSFRHGFLEHVAVADELEIAVVYQLEDVLRSPQDRQERG